MPEAGVSLGELAWRCRRGMRELDELLGGWLREHYGAAGGATQADFRAFLELPDPEIASCLLGRSVPAEHRFQALIAQILAHRPAVS